VIIQAILGIAVITLVICRQLRTRPVNGPGLRFIAVLAVIGLLETSTYSRDNHAGAMTLAALAGSLVLAGVFGAVRAATVRVWLDGGQAWSKGNWLTAALWITALAAHLGYDGLIAQGHWNRGVGAATVVLYLAVTLGVQRVIVQQRANRRRPVPAAVPQPDAAS
jgi:hypothetical protein